MRTFCIVILANLIAVASYSQSFEVTFTTKVVTQSGATRFSPKHVLAVWVETSDGKFVSSLKVMASERIGYLTAWSAKSRNNKVNAITGATLKSHSQQTITWNCKKYDGTTIPAGDYVLYIEETSGNSTGPNSSVAFTIGSDSYTTNPADGTTYTGMEMVYTAPSSGIKEENNTIQNVISAYPNPFKEATNISFYIPTANEGNLFILNLIGQEVFTTHLNSSVFSEQLYAWNGQNNDGKTLPAGTYFCIIQTNAYKVSYKLIKLNP